MEGKVLKLLNHTGKLILIRTCLASIPVYLSNCFWDNYEGHRKLYLAN
jgi:hypothetical protein